MQRAPGQLHGHAEVQRTVGAFVVTDGRYPPSLKIDRHAHAAASFCIVLSGGYAETAGTRSREAQPGTIIIHPAGEYHANHHGPARTRLLTVEVGETRATELTPVTAFLDEPWHRQNESLAVLAFRLARAASGDDPLGALTAESLIMDLLATAAREREAGVAGATWLKRVRDCLDAQDAAPPGLQHLAAIAGVHPIYLARGFRRAFGCSIGEYARRRRVARALFLLQDASLNLASIACLAGFADQSHMTRNLRAHTGLTPGDWQRRNRGGA